MAHFVKPPGSSSEGYDVDNKLAPGSLWRVRIPLGSTRKVALWGGDGLKVTSNNPGVVPNDRLKELARNGDLRIFELFGRTEGGSWIDVWGPDGAFWIHLQALVQKPASNPRLFNPGVNHNHQPSGRWLEIASNPNCPGGSTWTIAACKTLNPRGVVNMAIRFEFSDKPIALKHLNWYLSNGRGRDFVEDDNIKIMLERDRGVQLAIAKRIPRSQTSGKFLGHFKLEQSDFADQDLRYAFGAIDRLDFEVNFDARTIHVWFQDRYEWHPVYPGLYTKFSDDVARETNCVHAALVELKRDGAADFWMKGEAAVALNLIVTR